MAGKAYAPSSSDTRDAFISTSPHLAQVAKFSVFPQITPANPYSHPASPPPSPLPQRRSNIRPHHWHIPHKPGYRSDEISKQHKNTIQLNQQARKRPFQKDNGDAEQEGGGPF